MPENPDPPAADPTPDEQIAQLKQELASERGQHTKSRHELEKTKAQVQAAAEKLTAARADRKEAVARVAELEQQLADAPAAAPVPEDVEAPEPLHMPADWTAGLVTTPEGQFSVKNDRISVGADLPEASRGVRLHLHDFSRGADAELLVTWQQVRDGLLHGVGTVLHSLSQFAPAQEALDGPREPFAGAHESRPK